MKINEYRAWHKDEKRMHYSNGHMGFPSGKRSWWVWEAEFLIKMQFILIYDKYGVKVYEGDIIKFRDFDDEKKVRTGIVEYDVENARFIVNDWNQVLAQNPWRDEEVEVLGNCFQNPELLKEHE